MPNMLTMGELAEASDDDGPDAPVITVVDQNDKAVARLRTVASHFEDATTFFPMLGGWEVWQLINLSSDTLPIHLHLEPFHVLGAARSRSPSPTTGSATAPRPRPCAWPATLTTSSTTSWTATKRAQDTVRVNPNEIVELAVRFQTYSGRYIHHCHILEHEDRDMMRPIVIMPAELMPFMT
jgi:spore coat protein A